MKIQIIFFSIFSIFWGVHFSNAETHEKPYPIDTSHKLIHLEFSSSYEEEAEITLQNKFEKEVMNLKEHIKNGENKVNILTPNLPNGWYVLEIKGKRFKKYEMILIGE
jgi:hypothetical protein